MFDEEVQDPNLGSRQPFFDMVFYLSSDEVTAFGLSREGAVKRSSTRFASETLSDEAHCVVRTRAGGLTRSFAKALCIGADSFQIRGYLSAWLIYVRNLQRKVAESVRYANRSNRS